MHEHRAEARGVETQRPGAVPRLEPEPDDASVMAALANDAHDRPMAPGIEVSGAAASVIAPGGRLTRRQVVRLQRLVGNRVATSMVRTLRSAPLVQRVPMETPSFTETLYNTEGAGGQAVPSSYGGGVDWPDRYDMTRNGDTGVTLTVKIRFLSQKRNTIDPSDPTAPPGTPALGTPIGSPEVIPADDPDNRRAWAADMAKKAVAPWNGRLTLVEGPAPSPPPGAAAGRGSAAPGSSPGTAAPTPAPSVASPAPAPGVTPPSPGAPPKRLTVTFASEAVFELGEDLPVVIIHPMATVAGTPGQPIDSGNWYLNKGDYSADDAIIAAHEYGHLLGIPDEYSQSNSQLNALIHQAAPGSAPSAGAALDRASIQRMVLNSLKQPLYDALRDALPPVTAAMTAQKAGVRKAMLAATKGGIVDSAVSAELTRVLTTRTEGRIARDIPGAVAFETTKNFSSVTIAGEAVEQAFKPAAMSDTIANAYWKALQGAEGAAVSVPGVGDVTIDVASSVATSTAAGGAQQAAGAALATTAVTGPGGAGGGGRPALPRIAPPPSLVNQLTALPATWSTAGSLLETGVTPAAFAKAMVAAMKSADAAAIAAAAALPPARRRKKAATTGALYRRAYNIVQFTAQEAATQVLSDLLDETVKPTLKSSVGDLMTAIDSEVGRVMSTSPSAVPGLGTPDPNMTALVGAMKKKFEANKKAAAETPGRDPLGPDRTGKAAPQDVTYSATGMMGSNLNRGLRPDQFGPIVGNFNRELRTPGEKDFHAEVK